MAQVRGWLRSTKVIFLTAPRHDSRIFREVAVCDRAETATSRKARTQMIKRPHWGNLFA